MPSLDRREGEGWERVRDRIRERERERERNLRDKRLEMYLWPGFLNAAVGPFF